MSAVEADRVVSEFFSPGSDYRTDEERNNGVRLDGDQVRTRKTAVYAEMAAYVPVLKSGGNVREMRKPNGDRFTAVERTVLYKLLPAAYNTAKHGRVVVNTPSGPVATVYDCPANLAGRILVCARDGYMTELPLFSGNSGCNHAHCAQKRVLRKGSVEDTVVIVLPGNSEAYGGDLLSPQGVGTVEEWNSVYHYAVVATRLLKSHLEVQQQRRFFGYSFIPKSLFAEVVVFVARLFALKNVGFLEYGRHVKLVDGMRSGAVGSSDAFADVMSSVGNSIFESLSVQAWVLHDLTVLRNAFPNSAIPFRWYLEHFDDFRKGVDNLVGMVLMSTLLAEGGQAKLLGLAKSSYPRLKERFEAMQPSVPLTLQQSRVLEAHREGEFLSTLRALRIVGVTPLDVPMEFFRMHMLMRRPLFYTGKLKLPEIDKTPGEYIDKGSTLAGLEELQRATNHISKLHLDVAPMDEVDGFVSSYEGNKLVQSGEQGYVDLVPELLSRQEFSGDDLKYCFDIKKKKKSCFIFRHDTAQSFCYFGPSDGVVGNLESITAGKRFCASGVRCSSCKFVMLKLL